MQSFLDCVVDVFSGIIELLEYTSFGSFSLATILVGVAVVSMVVKVLVVRFGS
ncbi:MAG TPA: hypothetical protein IAA51_06740 [Candidatus Cottocaccamicrobium excrementipullorum]|nr:hypothetical protein [Candidatus Cottocaccamicrobium excrementipullorum]